MIPNLQNARSVKPNMLLWISLLFCLIGAVYSNPTNDSTIVDKLLKRGGCARLWRPENLPGKCFGPRPHTDFAEAKHIPVVQSAKECRAICCNLGDKCVSWQYHAATKDCRFAKILRLGLEATGTPDWCDPLPPARWNGHRIVKTSGQCESGEALPSQCFGLGPEQRTDGKALNTQECAQACCDNKECEMWQEIPGRGCFFSQQKGVFCSKKIEEAYEGGRKCVPGYCGGMEEQILGANYSKPKM